MTVEDPALIELLLRELPRFLKGIDPDAMEREGRIPTSLLERSAEFGLFGLSIDEQYEGLGLGLHDCCRVITELAKVDASYATSIGLHTGLGTRGISQYGSKEFKAQWLPQIARGECIGAFCGTEADAGSDLMRVRTQIRQMADGLRLNGEKSYVTNGAFAGIYTVLASSPDHGGKRSHTLVMVPRGSAGISVASEEKKLGLKASSTTTVLFEDISIAEEQLLAPPGQGMKQAHEILTWGRTLMSAGCLGVAERALSMAVGYVAQRKQFGRALSSFDIVRSQVSEMASSTYAMHGIIAKTAKRADSGEDIEAISTAAKIFCSETCFTVADRALQLHGAMGFMEETGVARLLRDCRVTRIFEGANDVLLSHLGVAVMARVPGARIEVKSPVVDAESETAGGETAKTAGLLSAAVVRQNESVMRLNKQLGIRIMRNQLILRRIGSAQTELVTAVAAYELFLSGEKSGELDRELMRHAVQLRLIAHETHLASLERAASDQERDRALSEQVYAQVLG